jgi:acyl carrier protein
MSDVSGAVVEWVQTHCLAQKPNTEVKDTTPLLAGLVDSLQVMELATYVEERFGVQLDTTDYVAENFATPLAVAALVERLRSGNAS